MLAEGESAGKLLVSLPMHSEKPDYCRVTGFLRMKIRTLFTPQKALAENLHRMILTEKEKLPMMPNLKGFH